VCTTHRLVAQLEALGGTIALQEQSRPEPFPVNVIVRSAARPAAAACLRGPPQGGVVKTDHT